MKDTVLSQDPLINPQAGAVPADEPTGKEPAAKAEEKPKAKAKSGK